MLSEGRGMSPGQRARMSRPQLIMMCSHLFLIGNLTYYRDSLTRNEGQQKMTNTVSINHRKMNFTHVFRRHRHTDDTTKKKAQAKA